MKNNELVIKVDRDKKNNSFDMYKLGMGLFAAGAVYYFGKKIIQKNRSLNLDVKYGTDIGTQKVVQFRNAFNPSGSSWLIGMDGTEYKTIMKLANEVANKTEWETIVRDYYKAYNESIVSRLESELSATELADFNAIISAKIKGLPAPATSEQKQTGTVSSSWVGKRVRLIQKPGTPVYFQYFSKESDIEDEDIQPKEGTITGTHISHNASNPWIVQRRKTVVYKKWTSPISYTNIYKEFIAVKWINNPTAVKNGAAPAYTTIWANIRFFELY